MKSNIAAQIQKLSEELGFDVFGITTFPLMASADPLLEQWLKEGFHGEMKYLENFKERRKRFLEEMPDAKSILVLGVNYFQGPAPVGPSPRGRSQEGQAWVGRVARYAWGQDYHWVIKAMHEKLIGRIRSEIKTPFQAKSCVDTQPIAEKFAAANAGLGFLGKHTVLLNKKFGPWLFLSEIVTDLDLAPTPVEEGNCGSCTSCQEICPTGALDKDYQLDARKCIAYLTIEHKGVIPRELRPKIKDWIFGCDECLTVCPFTSKQKLACGPVFRAESGHGPFLNIPKLFEIKSNSEYEKKFGDSAISRSSRKQLLRNACIVLGNSGSEEAIPYLEKALKDSSSLVRLHAAWALSQIQGDKAVSILSRHRMIEKDPEVLAEMDDLRV